MHKIQWIYEIIAFQTVGTTPTSINFMLSIKSKFLFRPNVCNSSFAVQAISDRLISIYFIDVEYSVTKLQHTIHNEGASIFRNLNNTPHIEPDSVLTCDAHNFIRQSCHSFAANMSIHVTRKSSKNNVG